MAERFDGNALQKCFISDVQTLDLMLLYGVAVFRIIFNSFVSCYTSSLLAFFSEGLCNSNVVIFEVWLSLTLTL
jgi:hypothetical protein